MATLKKYPKYKPSGIEWIGEIPEHWVSIKLKRITLFFYGNSLREEQRNMGDVPVYGSNGIVGYHDIDLTTSPCIIIGRKGSFGKINYSDRNCFPIDTTYYIDCTATSNDIRWLYYLLQILKLDSSSKDSAVPGLSREDVYDNLVFLPPLYEQHQIATYLDRKTRLIDELIEKKQKLIELLKEQRTAIINQAVTKGLYSDVKMKDSGIEWLGEVPKHWDYIKLKYISSVNDRVLPETTNPEYQINYVDIGGVSEEKGIENYELIKFKDAPSRARRIVKDGDIIVSTVRTYLKAIAYINNPKENLIVSTGFAVISPDTEWILQEFAAYSFTGSYFIDEVVSNSVGVNYPAINSSTLINIKIPLPPLEEQEEIIKKLSDIKNQIDCSINNQAFLIEKLKEYRTALISEVVTGKVDVREETLNK